jgi:hypothetical protein
MKRRMTHAGMLTVVIAVAALGLCVIPARSHHSFAMYDQTKVVVMTGVAHQFVSQANHAELHFYLIAPNGKLATGGDGKYVDWGVEMAGAAAVAREGISAATFPPGTIFSVKVNPLRDGGNFGSRVGAIAKCPWKTPPAAGKTCDTVNGRELLGGTTF